MQNHCYGPLIYHCIIGSMPAELLPNFSDKPSLPRSDSAASAAPGPDLSEPESSVNTAGHQLVSSWRPNETARCLARRWSHSCSTEFKLFKLTARLKHWAVNDGRDYMRWSNCSFTCIKMVGHLSRWYQTAAVTFTDVREQLFVNETEYETL